MNRPPEVQVPESLRYRDGHYVFERFPSVDVLASSRGRRTVARFLRAIHRPWFALWMPTGVAELTTIGRKSGKPRSTFVRACRDDHRAYLISIAGEGALWLKNARTHPRVILRFRHTSISGFVRDPRDDTEREAIRLAFCGELHPFDYMENMFHRRGWPNARKVRELHQAWFDGGTPLVVDLEH